MKYRIVGVSTKSGARMSLELEATSEYDARAQARSRGISVHNAAPVHTGGGSTYDNSSTKLIPPLPGEGL